jgi:DinB superfamily
MTPNDLLANAYTTAQKLLHAMIDDLTSEEFTRQPVPGANCAAWVVGHLALTLRNGLRRMGAADAPELPPGLEDKFKATKQAAGEQSGYGDPKALVAVFDACLERFVQTVRGLSAESLGGPADFRGPFATNRAEAVQFGALHIALHAGQLSTVRRSLGKPPVL